MEERKSTYQYLPVSHTGFQDMDSTKSRTSQSPYSCRACCTRLRSGKCNVVLLIASAFILWVIIHTVNSGEQSESAELKELQAEDKSARDWGTLKSDKLESEESLNGQYDGVYEDETEDTIQGNNILDHTEEDSELDHYGSTESSVFRDNEVADTDFANGSMEDMIMKVTEDKNKLYDTEEEIYEEGEDGKMTDNELTQERFAEYDIEEDKSETEAEINVSDDLNHNDSAVDEHEIIDSESLKNNANSLDTKSLRFEVENTDPVLGENDSKQKGLALETDTSNKEHISSNDKLLSIADTGKAFDEQSYIQNIAVNVDSTGGDNNSQLQLLDNKTSKSFNLTDGINFFKEPTNFQEGKSQNISKKTTEDILHVDSLQSDNEINQQSLNTDAKLANSNVENTNNGLVPDRINFAESFHKLVDPELDSIKFIQNSRKTGEDIPDLKNGQKLTFINEFKEYNGNIERISSKNTDEIILSEPKEATGSNPGEKAVLHDDYPPKNKDTQRNKRSLVHVLKVPLRPKKK